LGLIHRKNLLPVNHPFPAEVKARVVLLFVQTNRAGLIDPLAVGIVTGGVPVTVVHRVDRVEVLSVKLDSYEKELLELDEAGKILLSQADISEKKELIKAARETLLKRKLFNRSGADKHDN